MRSQFEIHFIGSMKLEDDDSISGGLICLNESALYIDYLDKGFIPETDALLDWRNRLGELRKELSERQFKVEIAAVDKLLSIKHEKE